jgi:hypothetical protein
MRPRTLRRSEERQRSVIDAAPVRRGRPRKFGRPARAVTLTLPEDVIATLHAVHVDLSHAVVRLVESGEQQHLPPRSPAELARFGSNALILVEPIATLVRFPGIELAPLPDGRALILLDPAMSPTALELGLRDAIDEGRVRQRDRVPAQAVVNILKTARRSKGCGVTLRSVIVVKSAMVDRQR